VEKHDVGAADAIDHCVDGADMPASLSATKTSWPALSMAWTKVALSVPVLNTEAPLWPDTLFCVGIALYWLPTRTTVMPSVKSAIIATASDRRRA